MTLFPLAIREPYATWLMLLIGVWEALLISAFVFGKPNPERTRHSVSWLLMGTSAVLVVAAFIWRLASAGWLVAVSRWLMLGMAFSFLGDMILADHIPHLTGTLPGMLSFSVTHVCYLLALSAIVTALELSATGLWFGVVLAYLAIGVVAWLLLVNSPSVKAALRFGALGYILLLAGMTGWATALALQLPALGWLALGANLFLGSDILLGNQLFRRTNWPHVHDIVWMLYITGQALIVFSNSPLARLAGAAR
jgi:hypothetical protein